jgi:spore maturation protein SpmA
MRTMAWMFHGASLAVDMIAVEIIACVVFYLGSIRLADKD